MSSLSAADRVNFSALAKAQREFAPAPRSLVGHIPTIAITPVADGRTGAYESNIAGTWRIAEKVYRLITSKVKLPDGTPVRVVVAPEIVYGPRSGALAQAYYAREGVSANIWVSRSWSYSDELMSACQGLGSSEWLQAAYGLNQTDRPGAVWLKAFCAAMDEKKRPIFSIYNPDLEDENGDLSPYVAERLLRFARCAAAVAERIRRAVEHTRFLYHKQEISVTVSIGVAQIKQEDASMESIFERTDKAMYEAKKKGRNLVVRTN